MKHPRPTFYGVQTIPAAALMPEVLGIPWTAVTLTLNQGATLTISGSPRWVQIGRLVRLQALLSITSAGTGGSGFLLTLPATMPPMRAFTGTAARGIALYNDLGTGLYVLVATTNGSQGQVQFVHDGGGGYWGTGGSDPTAANGDELSLDLSYESA